MKMLKIKGIEKDFIIESGNIYSIDVENPSFFEQLITALIDNDNDFFVYSIDYNPVDYAKESIIISDFLSLSPNNKQTTTSFQKEVANQINKTELKEQANEINESILKLFNDISKKLDVNVDYNLDLDLSKLLGMYKFSYSEDNSNVLNKIITFIKANFEIKNISFVLALNILPSILEKDIILLKKELELLNVSLININCIDKRNKKFIEYVTIDEDLCEF